MTRETINPLTPYSSNPTITYQVAMPQPANHIFEVKLTINNWQNSLLNLKMPVWTPGSYLVREYSRHVQELIAIAPETGAGLFVKKVSKNHWQIATEKSSQVIVSYKVFANDLTVRTNHLDASHGYFNGAALFFYIPQWKHLPYKISIITPEVSWQVSTALQKIEGKNNTFLAQDFDTLVDSPFEIGIHQTHEFEVLGKPHQWVIWGQGNIDVEQLVGDTKKIIEAQGKLYGGLPYQQYLFLLHLSAKGFGGLEHENCCSLNYPRLGFKKKETYNRFMQLVAHEFFHLWNVKRIRPKALEDFDYDRENYTISLWFCEGVTSYYDMLVPLRAKIYDRDTFLELLSKDLSQYLNTPGRNVQPLNESSFDAWIKLYRRDAYSDNSQISYYLKGELVSLILDLMIRAEHQNQRSLDDVMGKMWQQFGKKKIGYTPAQLQEVLETVAARDLEEFFNLYLYDTAEVPFNDYLEPFGLELKPVEEEGEAAPYLGMAVNSDRGQEKITSVKADSPAALAGIDPEDELLAINGLRATGETLEERLKDFQAGEVIQLSIFHQDELRTLPVKLQPPQPKSYEVKLKQDISPAQQQLLDGWLPPA